MNHLNSLAYIVSLGCPKNFVDTEVIAGSLICGGIGLTPDPDEADLFIINTCAFIPPAREEAFAVIEEALNWKKTLPQNRKVIVCGCIVQWDKNYLLREKYRKVDLWLGVDHVREVSKRITEIKKKQDKYQQPEISDKPEYIYDDLTPRLQLTLPHFAYLKIAEGCDNFCSYCTIPSLRGQKRSRSIQSIRDEAASLLNNGVKELILIAQDTTAYGEKGKNNLPGLIRELDKLDGDFWIRILYTHPAAYNEHIIEALAESEHVIPYLDIPVQHISHRILNSMNRKTCSREIKELITRLRSSIKHLTLRTTFITGYPGETEKEFSELIEFIKEYRFERVGAFPYYPEPGTTAADLPGQLPFSTAEDRCAELMEIQSKISLNINKSLVGKTFDVIIDFQEGRKFRGRTYMDAPEIDNSVEITSKKDISPGTFQKVKITGAGKYDLKGIVL